MSHAGDLQPSDLHPRHEPRIRLYLYARLALCILIFVIWNWAKQYLIKIWSIKENT